MLSFTANSHSKNSLFRCKEMSVWWCLTFVGLFRTVAEFCEFIHSNGLLSKQVIFLLFLVHFLFHVWRSLVLMSPTCCKDSGWGQWEQTHRTSTLCPLVEEDNYEVKWETSNIQTALMCYTSIWSSWFHDQKHLFSMMLECLVSLAVGEEWHFLRSLLILSRTAPLPPAATHWNSLLPRQRAPIKNASRCFLTRQWGISIQIQAGWK